MPRRKKQSQHCLDMTKKRVCRSTSDASLDQHQSSSADADLPVKERNKSLSDSPPVGRDILAFKDLSKHYRPQQIFCVAETVLNWKQMPTKPVAPGVEGDLQDCFSVLLGGNAYGDFKIKPLIVYPLANQSYLREVAKENLPVFLKRNTKLELTEQDFRDWFTGYYCPAVKDHCELNCLPNKTLLLLDRTAGYPSDLDDLSDNVKVLFMNPENVPYFASQNYVLFNTFMANYYRKILSTALVVSERGSGALKEYWASYNVKKAILNISEAWNEVTPYTVHNIWNELYQGNNRKVTHRRDIESLTSIVNDVAYLVQEIGLKEISSEDVYRLLDRKCRKPIYVELEKQRARKEFMDCNNTVPTKNLTPAMLQEAMNHVETAMSIFKNCDSDSERSSTVCQNVEKVLSCYRQLYKQKTGLDTCSVASDRISQTEIKTELETSDNEEYGEGNRGQKRPASVSSSYDSDETLEIQDLFSVASPSSASQEKRLEPLPLMLQSSAKRMRMESQDLDFELPQSREAFLQKLLQLVEEIEVNQRCIMEKMDLIEDKMGPRY